MTIDWETTAPSNYLDVTEIELSQAGTFSSRSGAGHTYSTGSIFEVTIALDAVRGACGEAVQAFVPWSVGMGMFAAAVFVLFRGLSS